MVDLAILDAADGCHRFNRGADHEARRRRAFAIGAEAAAQRRSDERAQNFVDGRAPAAFFFGRLQFVEPLAVGLDAAGDKQLRDQFILGTEMIVHGREIDVRRRDNVAQRHVAEAALGVKPLGGGENGGPGLVAGHRFPPDRELQFKQLYETIV